MFVVVETYERRGKAYQAISTSFIVDGLYYYPKNKKDVSKAITERRIPNKQDFYQIKKFKVVSKNFGNVLL